MQNWQRAAADYQNFKRRVEEERSETARFANAALIINLLPLIDDLDRALQNVDTHLAGLTWVDGIRLIHRKFQALLEMAGVEEIEADGQTFDPAHARGREPGPGRGEQGDRRRAEGLPARRPRDPAGDGGRRAGRRSEPKAPER